MKSIGMDSGMIAAASEAIGMTAVNSLRRSSGDALG